MERSAALHLPIRPFRPSDLDDLANPLADPEVMRCIEPPYTRAQSRAFLARYGLSSSPPSLP